MKRIGVFCFLLAFTLPALALAQTERPSTGQKTEEAGEHKEESPASGWAWANFVLLAGGLGYLTAKKAGPYFQSRSVAIRKNLLESQEILADAEARMAAVEQRLARLNADIEALRAEAMAENEAAIAQTQQLAATATAKIQARAEQEIANASRSARLELKRYSATLALQAAERKIRARITPKDQDALIAAFSERLDHPASRAQSSV